ncbi:hypothetical protein [Uliginosibacterium sp. 31-12]|uniref:hypothetical protein n=1 Tax=Uliginosibacterium sp. 31-12 TaxID=3062781 RepID=UPI0026E2B31A|nr:hypothetical protein [Uliginosibacterium sp. 31-12]MDO6387913.1 hypothetical protein [Uliginosibacterium sp. 31-12]
MSNSLCRSIQFRLRTRGFYVCDTRAVQYGTQFRLGVGPVVTVYTTGKVVVQGKFKEWHKSKRNYLISLLPKNTTWMA